MGQAPDILGTALKNAGRALTAAGQPSLTPEYLTKLRTMLRQAVEHLPGASPEDRVREADRRYRDCVHFLTGTGVIPKRTRRRRSS
jgi:hypothetical protein